MFAYISRASGYPVFSNILCKKVIDLLILASVTKLKVFVWSFLSFKFQGKNFSKRIVTAQTFQVKQKTIITLL